MASGEAGFALIEVMVSAVLVLVFAAATLSVIEKSGQAAGMSRSRGVATQLAQQDQARMRLLPITQLSNYHVTADPKTIQGTDYTIKSDATWQRDASGQVTCSANATRAEYVKVTSAVTWTGHATPVVLESYISPGVSGIALGSLTVKLHSDLGVGTSGIGVSYRGKTVLTDSDGCAVFTTVPAGTSDATWTGSGFLPNYVDRNGSNNIAQSVTIGSGQNSQVDQLFDRAGSVPVNFVDEEGNAQTWNTISAAHSGIKVPTNGIRTWTKTTKATSVTADMLFPFKDEYQLYAGTCVGNAPTTWDTGTTSATLGKVAAPAGATSAPTTSVVPNVAIWATSNGATNGTAAASKAVTIRPATAAQSSKMSGCTDPVVNLTTDAAGKVNTDLPYGMYQACMQVTTAAPLKYARRTFLVTPETTTATAEKPSHEIPTASLPAGLTNKAISSMFSTSSTAAGVYSVNTTSCATS